MRTEVRAPRSHKKTKVDPREAPDGRKDNQMTAKGPRRNLNDVWEEVIDSQQDQKRRERYFQGEPQGDQE